MLINDFKNSFYDDEYWPDRKVESFANEYSSLILEKYRQDVIRDPSLLEEDKYKEWYYKNVNLFTL